jgi:lycopene beta-cyclase
VKASTGYAYTRIQRDSAQIARSLVRYGHPHRIARPRARHQFMDQLLLRGLRSRPDQIEATYAALFSRQPTDRILRFLDEASRPLDELRLAAAVPRAPYLRALYDQCRLAWL